MACVKIQLGEFALMMSRQNSFNSHPKFILSGHPVLAYSNSTSAFIIILFRSMGAPLMVELEGETDPLKIAMKELKYVHTSYFYK